MATSLRIAAWNANGLKNHILEIEYFLDINKIDILLISESHATNYTDIKIPRYNIYYANHPDGTAHAGSAIIIKNTFKHHEEQPYITAKIQATVLNLETFNWPLCIAAIYSPPRHTVTTEEYNDFILTLGPRFLTAGDWNAKHTAFGSRLTTPKGRALYRTILNNNLNILSTGDPTYWPTDLNKIPDLLDFGITKGIGDVHINIESCYDLSSDHSPIIITLSTHPIQKKSIPKLCTAKTDWELFRKTIDEVITLNHRISNDEEIEEVVKYLTEIIQFASWTATPDTSEKVEIQNTPLYLRQMISEKRRMRRLWQRSRNPSVKRNLNRLTHEITKTLQEIKNNSFHNYMYNPAIS